MATEERVKARTFEQQLAIELHTLLCSYNHADECFWHYELSWDEPAHKRYLAKAEFVCRNEEVRSRSVGPIGFVKILQQAKKRG